MFLWSLVGYFSFLVWNSAVEGLLFVGPLEPPERPPLLTTCSWLSATVNWEPLSMACKKPVGWRETQQETSVNWYSYGEKISKPRFSCPFSNLSWLGIQITWAFWSFSKWGDTSGIFWMSSDLGSASVVLMAFLIKAPSLRFQMLTSHWWDSPAPNRAPLRCTIPGSTNKTKQDSMTTEL